ncbi:MAG: choice-of-anchor D domain-containing protein, partial [Armatimonadetes bacterium]|nr:choice-of-anchor D domain-containing protein [Armatimonadota bacterium]
MTVLGVFFASATAHASFLALTLSQVLFPWDLHVYGGYGADPFNGPFLFSWQSRVHFYGSHWKANAKIKVHFRGPMNHPTVAPVDHVLGSLFTDSTGVINGSVENTAAYFLLPYDNGVTGEQGSGLPDIWCPGRYQIFGVLDDPIQAQSASVNSPVHLLPQTIPTYYGPTYPRATIDWGYSRGLRYGFLGGHSPEYLDPEWTTVWSNAPVKMYGTVAETDDDANNQPELIAYHETPSAHYAHDCNLKIVPDPDYKWVLGTANLQGDPDEADTNRIELEWEAQNNYSPYQYDSGPVGMPLWLQASAGDRVFTVGKWAMDGGHRGEGIRTEIHPPRMLAVMRKRHTVVDHETPDCKIPAGQVDVFVSGHGGGVNQYFDALENILDNSGKGGGRLEDFMSQAVQDVYFRYGPGEGFLVDLITTVYGLSGGSADVYKQAGPSAIGTDTNTGKPAIWDYDHAPPSSISPWTLGPEERPVNDMDYDFDVVLPPAPAGATTPRVQIETHGEHNTGVNEVITFTNPSESTGLPTMAHIHLPYKGADNGIYARTYKFSWDAYSWPGRHFRVKIEDVTFFDPDIPIGRPWNNFTYREVMWVQVCGQWVNLTNILPNDFLNGVQQKIVRFHDSAPVFDVYLDDTEALRLLALGYDRCTMENKFVVDIGKGAYDSAGSIADALINGSGDNKNRGNALYSRLPNPLPTLAGGMIGHHNINGGYTSHSDSFILGDYSSGYNVGFSISYVDNPHADVTPSSVDFGDVILGSLADQTVKVKDLAKAYGGGGFTFDSLSVSASVTGGGYSIVGPAQTGCYAGESVDIKVRFSPTAPGQGTGSLVLNTNDPCNPTITIPLTAKVLYPRISVDPTDLEFPPTVVAGCSTIKSVTVANIGTAPLNFRAAVAGAYYSTGDYGGNADGNKTLAPGQSCQVPVNFAPTAVVRCAKGTLTFNSNDPIEPAKAVGLCGEGVQTGVRVLVLSPSGTPYAVVDQMNITSNGVPGTTRNLKNLPLTT